LRLTDRY